MKRNTLYTVSKWNRPAFMPEDKNIFAIGGVQTTGLGNTNFSGSLSSTSIGSGLSASAQASAKAAAQSGSSVGSGAKGIGGGSSGGGANWGAAAGMAAGALGNINTGDPRGMWDTLDPVYHLAGGRESGVGNAFSDTGVMLTQAGLSTGNYYLALAGAAAKIVGGLANAAFGIKTDKAKLKNAEDSIKANSNFVSATDNFDDIKGPYATASSDIYEGGWFSGGKARRKNEEMKKRIVDASQWAYRSVENNTDNLKDDQMNAGLANYIAFGGQLDKMQNVGGYDLTNKEIKEADKHAADSAAWNRLVEETPKKVMFPFGGQLEQMNNNNMGAIEYGFMSDYLTAKKKQAENKRSMTNLFAGMPNSMFAFGGDMQTNSADFSTGLTHIDAGGSHELNPYDGVQVGVDSEGAPNLVEEGETIYNDYVFSNRILADEATKELFHLPKKKDITFADISKKLEKQIAERSNDPLSRAGFESQMQRLTEQQERQKQEMEAERAKAAFEALSPEEKAAIIQQQAIEENMGNQGEISPNSLEMPMPDETQGTEQPEVIEAEGGNLFGDGGSKKRKNVGTWKDDKQNHWDVFTKPGLKRYIENLKAKLNMAPDDETKNAIRREAMSELNTLQQSYYDHVREGVGKSNYDYDENVEKHQRMFDRLYGNTGFYSKDDEGNVRNLIAEAINLPKGAATDDKPDNWFDGYNGPRTSIRNFGSTEYGDNGYYSDLVKEFADLGLTYSPNQNWKYGDNQLYGLSIPEEEKKAEEPKIWDGSQWTDRPVETPIEKPKPEATKVEEEDVNDVKPKHRAEWMRYAGIFGPALGLGLMGAGVGKPDTSGLEAAVKAGNASAHLADYKPLGNYLRYRPMDIWFEQNRMDANARAADRAIVNNAAPVGTKMAGILANGYNNQIAAGELYRKALEYNDAKKERVAEFNRGTDQFNAEAYNRTSQFNAEALNRQRQYAAQLALQAAREKMDADAAWTSGIYGNLSGLFKGISDIGRENALWNMASSSAADGVYGNLGDSNTAGIYTKPKKKSSGGKIKKRGLTY